MACKRQWEKRSSWCLLRAFWNLSTVRIEEQKEAVGTDLGRNMSARFVTNSLCQVLILKITATAWIAKLVDGV